MARKGAWVRRNVVARVVADEVAINVKEISALAVGNQERCPENTTSVRDSHRASQ